MRAAHSNRLVRAGLVVVAVLGLVVALALVLSSVVSRTPPAVDRLELAREVATDYARAVEDGDAATALELAGLDRADTACPALVAADHYATVPDRPSGVEILDVSDPWAPETAGTPGEADGDLNPDRPDREPQSVAAHVAVRFVDLSGAEVEGVIALAWHEDRWLVESGGVLGPWTLAESRAVEARQADVTVDDLCRLTETTIAEAIVLPGRYAVTASDPRGVAEDVEVELVTGQVRGARVLTPSVEAQEQVQREVDAWIEACLDAASDRTTCPANFQLHDSDLDRVAVTDVTLEAAPEDSLEIDDRLGSWTFRAARIATVTGTWRPERSTGCDGCVPGEHVTLEIGMVYEGVLWRDEHGDLVIERDDP